MEKYGDVNGKERGKYVVKIAKEIIAHKHGLSKMYKACDFFEYGRAKGSDYAASFNIPSWKPQDYEFLANQISFYNDEKGEVHTGFTEEGSIILFKQLYYRLLFNACLNYHPIILAKESAYKLGIEKSNLTNAQIFKMPERKFDGHANLGVQEWNTLLEQTIRNIFGGEKSYCGYGPKEKIMVIKRDSQGNVTYKKEFLQHLETEIKQRDPELYKKLKPMAILLTTPAMIELKLISDPNAFIKEQQKKEEQPQTLNFKQLRELRKAG